MTEYSIFDLSLAEAGKLSIEYAEKNMPIMLRIRKEFGKSKPFRGLVVGIALHVTKETGVLVRTLAEGGAKVVIASCNPLSTQDDVAAALVSEGFMVFAKKGCTKDEYYSYLESVVKEKPDITIDDGCDLVTLIHTKYPELTKKIIGGCEETTTGVIRLHSMEKEGALKYPVVAVNDNKTKHLLDNYYGTGQSAIDGILRATNALIAGKIFVVCGYGDVGKGSAQALRALSAQVWVTEVDPICALQAAMEGYRVVTMDYAADKADIFVSATGNYHVITHDHMAKMKNQAIVCNIGHFDNEIDVAGIEKYKWEEIKPQVDHVIFPAANGKPEKRIIILAKGRLVNLGCGTGHPSYVMSSSFANQVIAQI